MNSILYSVLLPFIYLCFEVKGVISMHVTLVQAKQHKFPLLYRKESPAFHFKSYM